MGEKNLNDERLREADRILDEVASESEVFGTSSFVRTAVKAKEHFSRSYDENADPVEAWVKRFGRGP